MASIANRRARLNRSLTNAKERHERIETQIGYLMTQRADCEDHQAEIMKALSDLDELEANLPNG